MSLGARLNKRITLQVMGPTQDAAGQPVAADWTNFITEGDGKLWAEVRDSTGREFVAAGATQNLVLTTIIIRYRAGVLPKMRALHVTDVYSIEAVLGQDQRMLALMCSRAAA